MSVSQPEPREEREEMLIKELNLKGILSFGHDSPPLALRDAQRPDWSQRVG